MEIRPAGTTPFISPVAPVGSSTSEEQTAQVLCDFGYLALLLNENEKASTPALVAQIKQLVSTITNATITDPTAESIYMAAFTNGSITTLINGNGTINSSAASLYLSYFESGNAKASLPSLAEQVMGWLSGADNNGTPPVDLQTAQDPTTIFTYLMFMSSTNLCNDSTLEGDVENLMKQSGIIPFSQTAAYFMAAYCYANNVSPSLLTGLFVGNAATPDLDTFIAAFQNLEAGNGWTPPAGMTGDQALDAMMATIEPYLTN